MIAIVHRKEADAVLAAMQQHSLAKNAFIIGEVVDQRRGVVVARTGIGGTRVMNMQIGE